MRHYFFLSSFIKMKHLGICDFFLPPKSLPALETEQSRPSTNTWFGEADICCRGKRVCSSITSLSYCGGSRDSSWLCSPHSFAHLWGAAHALQVPSGTQDLHLGTWAGSAGFAPQLQNTCRRGHPILEPWEQDAVVSHKHPHPMNEAVTENS